MTQPLVSTMPNDSNSEKAVDQGRLSDIVLTITLNAHTRAVSLKGPIHDDVLCYGMMEKAKLAIDNWHKHPPKGLLKSTAPRLFDFSKWKK